MDSTFKPALLLMSGRVLGFTATFFIPVVLVRIFDQAEFGTYKQLFLIYATLYGIAQIGMAESLYYFLPSARQRGGRYVLNAILVLVAAGLACLALLTSAAAEISQWMSNGELSAYMVLLGSYLLLMLGSTVLEIVMIARQRYRWAFCSYACSDLTRATLFILPVLLLPRLAWLLLGGVVFAAVRFGATLCYLRHEFAPDLRPDATLLTHQLAYALPFELAVLVEIMHMNLPQYAVSYYFDAATFAIYSVGCLQVPLIEFMGISAANVMMVKMSEALKDGRHKAVLAMWHDTTRKLALVFSPLVGLLLVVAHELMVLLFTESYSASVPIFMISSLGIVLAALQTDGVLRVYAETRFLLVQNVIRLVLIAALMHWFLSAFGLAGAVLVSVFGMLVGKALALARMKSLMQVGFSDLLPWRALAAILATAVAVLPALLLKSVLETTTLIPLLTCGLIYIAAYGALLFRFDLLSIGEKVALVGWLQRWTVGVARAGVLRS